MPHLQYELNRSFDDATRRRLTEWTTEQYGETMATGTGHVAVTIREREPSALSLGRALPDEPVAILDADVRAGRSATQRETFASAVVDWLDDNLGIPAEHCYVVYTEHDGPDFMLSEGPLASWSSDEADEGPTE